MFLNQFKSEVVCHQTTNEGETMTLMSDGVLSLPDGGEIDMKTKAKKELMFDNHPGNVFRVVGDMVYVAGLMKNENIVAESPTGDVYHSNVYVLCIDWKTGQRVWDRKLGLGGATALAVSSDSVYVAGFREYVEDDRAKTVVAKLDLAGQLVWQVEEEVAGLHHPTEIDLRPNGLVVYVDSFNTFLGVSNRFFMKIDHDGLIQDIHTL